MDIKIHVKMLFPRKQKIMSSTAFHVSTFSLVNNAKTVKGKKIGDSFDCNRSNINNPKTQLGITAQATLYDLNVSNNINILIMQIS